MLGNEIIIYCDGGCRGNGKENNIGSWGYYLKCGDLVKEKSQAYRNTTNNKMELMGAIESLKAIKKKNMPTKVNCDSQYVVDGINSWIKNWKKNNWKTANGPVKNQELWKELDSLVSQFDNIKFIKVKGHSDCEGNNRVDYLCNIAMDNLE